MERPEKLKITPGMIEAYLLVLEQEGKKKKTIEVYRSILRSWYQSLPEDQIATEDILGEWRRTESKKIAEITWHNRTTVMRSFQKYLENPDSFGKKAQRQLGNDVSSETEMSREEYQLLLQTAKEMGHRRTYLLIKTIVCLGIRTTEMPHLSVEGVEKGAEWIPFRTSTRHIKVFEPVRTELLQYSNERGVREGAVFVTKEGAPLQHFLIWKEIKKICRRMGLPENKGTPKSLYQLYVNTRKAFAKESAEESEGRYVSMLQTEEALVGWE